MTMNFTALFDLAGRLTARQRFLLVAAGSWGLLGAGLLIGIIDKLNPCPLCIFQRILYIVIGFMALGAAAASGGLRTGFAVLGIAAAAGGLATALYQTYMQMFPGAVAECNFAEPNLIESLVFWLGDKWEFMFLATGMCGARDWTFLGFSMANWSIPCFTVFGAMLVWAMRASNRPVA
jgi:disulfide bond formation protein DsbB